MRHNTAIAVLSLLLVSLTAAGCGNTAPAAVSESTESVTSGTGAVDANADESGSLETSGAPISYQKLTESGSLNLQYAEQYQITTLAAEQSGENADSSYYLITIPEDDQHFLLIPQGAAVPSHVPDDVQILQQPLDHTYLVSSSVMDYICKIDALDDIAFSGLKEKDWYIQEAQEAMDLGYIQYAGKYNAPDYELLLGNGCSFAIENTMIYHNPDVLEKLKDLGIPSIVERSSYESNPLGRLEWIRLYGVFYNKEEEADSWYQKEIDSLKPILQEENTGKTVAFFSVTSNGSITIRKPGDYVSKLIEMAGGKYIFTSTGDEDENALSTENIQMEQFYATANDADILIYNSTIEGEIGMMQDLINKDSLFSDFKAVQDGNVYCTGKDLFQEPTGMGDFLQDLHAVFTGTDENLHYLTKVTQ